MKKITTLFLTLLIALGMLPLNGQEYYPLLEDGKTWSILENTWDPYVFGGKFKTITILCMGDSTINGVTYKKLYSSYAENPINWDFYCLAREDDDKAVWRRDTINNIDKVVYDFSLTTGNTSTFWFWNQNNDQYTFTIDSVSEITINGTNRKIWFGSSFPTYPKKGENSIELETCIEGIGSSTGLIYPGTFGFAGGYYRLLCVYKNDTLIYETNYTNWGHIFGCYYVYNGPPSIMENERQEILIYPNPASNEISVKLETNHQFPIQVAIYSVQGSLMFLSEITEEEQRIDVKHLPSGMYMALFTGQDFKATKKLIIHH